MRTETTDIDIIAATRNALSGAAAIRPKVGGFPHFAEALRIAGLLRIETSLATGGSVYHWPDGAVVQRFPALAVGEDFGTVPDWDEPAVIGAIRADQAGLTTFPEFLQQSWRGGVIRFTVDLQERTCTYYGAAQQQYVERYPASDLAP